MIKEKKNLVIDEENVDMVFNEIKGLIVDSRNKVYSVVNTEMLHLYWSIGKIIMEIQNGDDRAEYGEKVLEKISIRLNNEFGKGFSIINLRRMRKFYCLFQIRSTVLNELSWSHYLELIKIDDKNKRLFYQREAISSNWSVRELQRQIASLLYERIIISKDKKKIKELSKNGQIINTARDLIKDPFVLEFLDIKENTSYLESDLEKSILRHLKEFLLEL